jgi:hypothetical protein
MELKKVCSLCGTKWTYDFPTCVFCGGMAKDLPGAPLSASTSVAEAPPAPVRRARPWWKIWARG